MDIGKLIKKARTEKGYTQEELAERVGVKKSAVAKWENGRVSEIKRSNLKKLADALGLKPTSLLGDIEENPVETAERMAGNLLYFELLDDDERFDLFEMLGEYKTLSDSKKTQVREYVHFLSGRD